MIDKTPRGRSRVGGRQPGDDRGGFSVSTFGGMGVIYVEVWEKVRCRDADTVFRVR